MAQRSGLTRGDRRRNNRIEALRAVVRPDRAVLSIDLGEDKQVATLIDHDCRVLGRRVVKAKAHQLGGLLAWAGGLAAREGFAGVVVACEPTGHRWRSLMGLADEAGMGFVCVQSLRVHLEREADDYTRDKTDHKDAVLIGRLVVRLECYLPERADRGLGPAASSRRPPGPAGDRGDVLPAADRRPARLLLAGGAVRGGQAAGIQDVAGLPERGRRRWRGPGRPRRRWRGGVHRHRAGQLPRFNSSRPYHQIVRTFFEALSDQTGVTDQRPGALERVGLVMADWQTLRSRLSDVESRMVGVLDAMGLTGLVTSIPGVSAVGAAVILAETGDPSRFASARSVVKHAGLNPIENTSATFRGTTRVSHRGRPGLRVAAWRAVWGALPHNQVLADRYTHLTTRARDQLAPGQARAACAATLLRWLYAIVTRRQAFEPGHRLGPGPHHPTEALAA